LKQSTEQLTKELKTEDKCQFIFLPTNAGSSTFRNDSELLSTAFVELQDIDDAAFAENQTDAVTRATGSDRLAHSRLRLPTFPDYRRGSASLVHRRSIWRGNE